MTDKGNQKLVVCVGELIWDLFPSVSRLGGAPANVAFHLAQLGDRSVLLSRVGADEQGKNAIAQLQSGNVEIVEPSPDADTVGAGDGFCAALLYHLLRRHDARTCNLAANAYGAFVASRAGGMPVIDPDVQKTVAPLLTPLLQTPC